MNELYYGDNLDVLRTYVDSGSVDLVYLDPPFNSQQDYNVLFREKSGSRSQAQIRAFTDTWTWDESAESTYKSIVSGDVPDKVARAVEGMLQLLGRSDMLAYLVMMTPRLVELHRALSEKGSLYLHCDPTASHYLKVLLDAIFGPTNFRNEIVWKRYSSHGNVKRKYGAVHDVLLFYAKSGNAIWNQQYTPYSDDYVSQFFRHVDDSGRRYRTQNVINPAAHRPNLKYEWHGHVRTWKWTRDKMQELHDSGQLVYSSTGYPQLKQYLDASPGAALQDVWADVASLQTSTAERLGFPTQKPVALLERIINASTAENSVVLDPFCGCGTTIAAAQQLGRQWIGIDITFLAIGLIEYRLNKMFPGASYEVRGVPADMDSARALASSDAYQFQWWVCTLLKAQPLQDGSGQPKKGADSGIDGVIRFLTTQSKAERILLQVKGGKSGPAHVRDLRGTLERESAAMGILVTLEAPTSAMRKEAVSAGNLETPWGEFPRVQVIGIADLLNGDGPRMPPAHETLPAAKEAKVGEQLTIG